MERSYLVETVVQAVQELVVEVAKMHMVSSAVLSQWLPPADQ